MASPSAMSVVIKVKDGILNESSTSTNIFVEDVSFIGKLAMMLQDPIALSLVSWSANEDSIVIYDRLRFASQILPRLTGIELFTLFWSYLFSLEADISNTRTCLHSFVSSICMGSTRVRPKSRIFVNSPTHCSGIWNFSILLPSVGHSTSCTSLIAYTIYVLIE